MNVDTEEEDIRVVVIDGVTSSPIITKAKTNPDGDLPVHLKLSLQLTFSTLSRALSQLRCGIPFQRETPNPYIAMILTFMSTMVENSVLHNTGSCDML